MLLAFQLAGEFVARKLGLLVPGPVVGMALLFIALMLRPGAAGRVPDGVSEASRLLLSNLGLLFVPAGVGVVAYLPALGHALLPILLAVLVGTAAAMAVTGWLAQTLLWWKRA